MKHLLVIICKRLTLAIVLAGCMMPVAQSATSPSYQLTGSPIDQATPDGIVSQHYQMRVNDVTWRKLPAVSANYKIVPLGGFSSSSSSASSVSSSENASSQGTVTSPATNRRPRPADESASSAPTHGAASSSSAPSTQSSSSVSSAASSVASFVSSEGAIPTGPVTAEPGAPIIHTFFDAIETIPICTPVQIVTTVQTGISLAFWILFLLIIVCTCAVFHMLKRKKIRYKKNKSMFVTLAIILMLAIIGLFLSFDPERAHATGTAPQAMVYNGQLLDSVNQPITASQNIRFSFWKSTDAVIGDVTGTGSINTGAPSYGDWQEVHTITPDSQGYFSVELGTITPIPDMSTLPPATLLSLFLQVEVKVATTPNTSYELLDIDPTNDTMDRSSVLSVPFALNADRVDQRHVGTGSGEIAVLGSGGILPISMIPGGTNGNTFGIDADGNSAGDLMLQFGSVLNKTLSYSISDHTFRFNDNVDIQGNLTVTGLINGMDLNNILGSADALRVSSGGGLNVNVFGGSYRLNGTIVNYSGGSAAVAPSANQVIFFGSGGLTVSQAGFPIGSSYIPLAEVLTSAGSVVTVTDRRVLQSDDRQHNVLETFTPAYEKASYEGDGSDNVGQLSVGNDSATLKNFYRWTSTRTTLQDYDIILRIPISPEFVRWSQGNGNHPLTLQYHSTSDSTADNALAIQVFDTAGAPVTLSGATTGLASTTWRTTIVDFQGTPTWTAGEEMVVRFKVSAKQAAEMHLGTLKLSSVDMNH